MNKEAEYFEVDRLDGDGLCSDDNCPCPKPGTKIPYGTGYLYISQKVIDFRRDVPSKEAARKKFIGQYKGLEQRQTGTGLDILGSITIITPPGKYAPILMCERAARLRGLDLDIAAMDAKVWWETGKVPYRVTPLSKHRSTINELLDMTALNHSNKKWWRFWK